VTREQQPFWLAVIIVIGGGVLMAFRPDTTPNVMQTVGLVAGFYFGHRAGSNGNGYTNGNGNGGTSK
jgi:hypothetical protein